MKIPAFFNKQMTGASKWLGKVKFIGTHISVYVTALTLVFSATSTYSVSIVPFLIDNGIPELPFVFYIAAIALFLGILLIFEYKVMIPGFFSLSNKQWYEHDNPMVADIKELKDQLNRIEKLLEAK